jgi:uncharacterized protein YbaR (Trm112 family)
MFISNYSVTCPICKKKLTIKLNHRLKENKKIAEADAIELDGKELICEKCKKESVIIIDWHNMEPMLRAV